MTKKTDIKADERKLSEMLKYKERRYHVVNVLAKRSRALIMGEEPLIKITNLPVHDPTYIAMEELKRDKLKAVEKKEKEKVAGTSEKD